MKKKLKHIRVEGFQTAVHSFGFDRLLRVTFEICDVRPKVEPEGEHARERLVNVFTSVAQRTTEMLHYFYDEITTHKKSEKSSSHVV